MVRLQRLVTLLFDQLAVSTQPATAKDFPEGLSRFYLVCLHKIILGT